MLKVNDQYQTALSLDDVSYERGGTPICSGVSFDLLPGQALQVFGRNGAGKSSLLNLIAGLAPPRSGDLLWSTPGGTSMGRPPRKTVLYLSHQSPVKLSFSVIENARFWRRIYGASEHQMVSAIEDMGLSGYEDQPAYKLSAGQKKRLDFVRAVISHRPVWLLDEPTASLDQAGKTLITRVISNHLGKSGIALIATHEALELPSTFLVLEDC